MLVKMVLYKDNIYKIIYAMPSLEILFYPVYAAIILYFDILFLTDYLYYYINPSYEIMIRIGKTNIYLLKKFFNCFLMFLMKYALINICFFEKVSLPICFIYTVEELFLFLFTVKVFDRLSIDKNNIVVLIVLLLIKQHINSLWI